MGTVQRISTVQWYYYAGFIQIAGATSQIMSGLFGKFVNTFFATAAIATLPSFAEYGLDAGPALPAFLRLALTLPL